MKHKLLVKVKVGRKMSLNHGLLCLLSMKSVLLEVNIRDHSGVTSSCPRNVFWM